MQKRTFLQFSFSALTLSVALSIWAAFAHAALPVIEVYKSAYCGCCEQWVTHLRDNGFTVKSQNVPDPAAYRTKLGIPTELGSCHSAKVGDYVLEGHVPASDIKRLLAERPAGKGLAVPGMPLGSPGMEADRAEAYDVMLIQSSGKHTVFEHHAANSATSAVKAKPIAPMSEGEVRKVDRENGKVTIKHGTLANLGMPAMTMVFLADKPELLQSVKAGDKVRFVAEKSGGAYRVTRLEAQP